MTPARSSPDPLAFDPDEPEIQILVNRETHDITVAPTVAHLKRKQVVHWTVSEVARDGSVRAVPGAGYLLTFRDVNAMGTNEIRGRSGGPVLSAGQRKVGRPSPPTTRAPGRYHYKVMVCIDDVIYADVGCPSVIIKR